MRIWKVVLIGVLFVAIVLPYLIPTQVALTELPSQAFAESRYVHVGNTLVHFRQWEPQAPTLGKVLMVHGLGGSTFSWRHNVKPLVSAGYLVVAVDLPGFGYSDRWSNVFGQADRATLLWQLLTKIDQDFGLWEMRWHLMGHSMGGGTVVAMSTQEATRTASVVLVAGAVFSEKRSSNLFLAIPPIERWIEVAFTHVLATTHNVARFLSSAYGRSPNAEEIAGYLAPLRVRGTVNTLIGLSRNYPPIPIEQLANEKFPVLAIWGDQDAWVRSSEGYRLKQLVERTQLVSIRGASHCPMETHANEFNALVLEFLRGL